VSDFDEAPLARQVAKLYGTEHYEIHLTEQDLIEHHEKLLSQFGQPFADSSALPTYLISRFAREQVKVVLSGDGGDEQFGGYGNYQRYLQIRRIDLLRRWRPTRELVTSLASIASSLVGIWRPYVSERMRFYAKVLRQEAAFMFQDLTSIIDMAGMSHLAGERLQPFVDWDFFRRLYERDPDLHLDGVMLHDLKHFLVDDVLQKVDIMSMAVSLEVRVPLLDHRVVEKAVQISWKDKLSFSTTKRILRRLYRSKLPEAVLQAPKKGFSIPIDKWFRGPLRTEAQDLLLGKSCVKRGILNPTAVKVLLDDHQSGAANNGHRIWTLMALEKWFRQVEGT
jgi:asparagine synthase (glutamine-hydrolysing)